jgi:hypothetical protein
VLCAWEPIFEAELLDLAGRGGGKAPLLCLCLGYLSEARRQALARLCRERGHPLLILDEALALYLCTQPAPRLQAFFRCAAPFAAVDPYASAAGGPLPPELFAGRARALQELLAPSPAATLLIGGRRAGKTALLRELERRAASEDPEGGRLLVRHIDLHAEGLGRGRPIEDLPALLGERLGRAGRRPQEWLDAGPGRRIVLLLDEADALLEADRRGGYAQVEWLRDLMERTALRFKAVLCGGTAVARLARDRSSPRAHVAGALALGLLAGADGRAALALLRGPLEAAGALFASPELPWLIIARTDGDPGLLLIAGRLLLARAAARQANAQGQPLAQIEAADVAQVLESEDLRAAEAERLRTLELDGRYRALLLPLAARCAAQEAA